MEGIEEAATNTTEKAEGFLDHMLKMDTTSKHELLNIVQYALLAVIPVIVMNKSIQNFIPEAEEDKTNAELVFETVSQIVVMFLGIYFIHRLIIYVPTYSGTKHSNISITNVIIAFLIIVLSFQTRLGEKANILVGRAMEMINGSPRTELGKGNKEQSGVNVIQPLAHHNVMPVAQPPNPQVVEPQVQQSKQSIPDYNDMYAGPKNPLQGANSPGMMEPIAANDTGGGYSMF